MSALRDTDEFKRGRSGECVFAGWFRQRGCFVIPSYDYSGEDGDKAPKMDDANLSLVIPDLDVAKAGTRWWVEVKTKWKADFYRKGRRLEHGISKRHYEHYLRVQRESGTPVWLCIYEERDGYLLGARLDDLGPYGREYRGSKMGWDGMIFWPRERFKVFGKVAPAREAAA